MPCNVMYTVVYTNIMCALLYDSYIRFTFLFGHPLYIFFISLFLSKGHTALWQLLPNVLFHRILRLFIYKNADFIKHIIFISPVEEKDTDVFSPPVSSCNWKPASQISDFEIGNKAPCYIAFSSFLFLFFFPLFCVCLFLLSLIISINSTLFICCII